MKMETKSMESKKISRTVRKRLNKKGRLQRGLQSNNVSYETNFPENLPQNPHTTAVTKNQSKKQKKKVAKIQSGTVDKPTLTVTNESKTETEPTSTTTSNRNRKRNPENKVVFINSNYGSNDPNSVGGLIQAQLVDLRNQSKNIKTASDLTESQAHVVKRQITRLQGAEKERVFKRPKHYNKTIGEATKELMLLMEKQKPTIVTSNKSTNG